MSNLFEAPVVTSNSNGHVHSDEDLPLRLPLELLVDDRDVIRALVDYPEGNERNRFALEALKIGVLALRHIAGRASADLLRLEGDRFIGGLQKTLDLHKQTVQDQIESKLREYFDPKDGRFTDRVQRLVAQDGELSQLIKGYIDGENCLFARTLLSHVGRDSPVMKVLDPRQSDGLLTTLQKIVEVQLTQQRDHLVNEFSLNNKEGALARLVCELTKSHGDVGTALQNKIDIVMKEFSLNEENSALSRLVKNVTQAQRTITSEFSLDSETSCLSRLKRELMTILEAHVKTNADFQTEVKGALRELTARREEQARSTLHGGTFQSAVFEFLHCQSQQQGDICDFTADRVGAIKNCKVGDVVIALGADTSAAGAKIAVEAKEEKECTLAAALTEIESARKNRLAQVGLFVFSRRTAPRDLRSLRRFGDDIVVVWDAEDTLSDCFLLAALELARLMCLCHQRRLDSEAADFISIETAILDIEKRAKNLDVVCRHARTVQTAGGKILKRAQNDRKSLDKQVAVLRGKFAALRAATGLQQ
ncbi:MAG TPA: hypothetical protein VGK58_16090 [Lacipirellulaceae bacterium]